MTPSDLSGGLNTVKFGPDGLVPVVTQDAETGAVLMQAYANREALEHTLTTRQGTYFSRSRNELWVKGLTSGNVQQVVSVALDCDGDSVLYWVRQSGPACHTGAYSCFYTPLLEEEAPVPPALDPVLNIDTVLERVYATVQERLSTLPEKSYVARLHAGGLDRVLKKIVEESGEVLLAAKNAAAGSAEERDAARAELRTEVADLFFHTLFAMAEVGVTPAEVAAVLEEREGRTGLKGPKEAG
ncbi:bifunctional phosphoribosyl-AMP cyclohydrolase/phosphoribosyl-ATP diphosphatase HisIE [Deinococcus altitudinis]|uniref:bifunctional phosphoribosyl-AMP cyclohydrolase/phosphoribosyl-ATP diphosphatase HisIE n=1 Tax=Deinococcus altitudinis TaxID=468914 RepID=UPI0038926C8A